MLELFILLFLFITGLVLVTIMNHCKHDYEFIELQLSKGGSHYTQVMKCRKCGQISVTKV